jgi:hypothetical protein
MKYVTPLCALVLCAFGSLSEASTIPVSSSVVLGVTSDLRPGSVSDTDSASQAGTTNPLTATSSATATDGTTSIQTFASATATWSNSSIGSVIFSDIGWITANEFFGDARASDGLDWSYRFTPTTDGLFTLNWAISTDPRTTSSFGLNGFIFNISSVPGATFLDLDTSGALTRAVTAGNTYTVIIGNNAQISGGLGTRTAFMDANFDWTITDTAAPTVPEPGTASLLALGLTAGVWRLNLAARRRRG